jgi:hypothetical protein
MARRRSPWNSGPMGLTASERVVLLMACWSHAIAACPRCARSYTTAELASDLWPGEDCPCRVCGADLIPCVRNHLLACSAVVALGA